jgi:PKD repeat protein
MKAMKKYLFLLIYILLWTTGNSPGQNITQAEYFFNTDPGVGNAIPLIFTAGEEVNFSATISTEGLDGGFHTLFIRFLDEEGTWSIAQGRAFLVNTYQPEPYLPMVDAEFFFDDDPGVNNGTPIAFESNFETEFIREISMNDFPDLEPGFHNLFIRFKDEYNKWSIAQGRSFYIPDTTDTEPALPLTAAEYYVDNDPGFGMGTALDFEPGLEVDETFMVPVSGIPAGEHLLYVRFMNENNIWGIPQSHGFSITDCVSPQPEFSFENDCVNNEITFIDESMQVDESAEYAWDIGNNGTVDYTTPGDITHVFTASGSYEVKLTITNSGGCSGYVIHTVEIYPLPVAPEISIEGSTEICDGDSVTLYVPDNYDTYLWSNGEETYQIDVTEAGDYDVTVTNEYQCEAVSDLVTITVFPTYSETDFASICNGETFTFGSQTLTQPGVYTETFSSVWGCDSVVELTLEVIIVDVSVTQDGITLTANATDADYQWLDCNNNFDPIPGATQQSFTPDQDGSYAVEVTQNGCTDISECIQVTGVGITDYDSDNNLKVYPNPARGYVRIEITRNAEIEIINIAGKSIFKNLLPAGSNVIYLSNIPQGVYIIKSISRKGIITKKLVILDP